MGRKELSRLANALDEAIAIRSYENEGFAYHFAAATGDNGRAIKALGDSEMRMARMIGPGPELFRAQIARGEAVAEAALEMMTPDVARSFLSDDVRNVYTTGFIAEKAPALNRIFE